MKLPRPVSVGFSSDRQTFTIEFRRDDPDAHRLLGLALAAHAEPPSEPVRAQDATDPRFS